MSHPPLLLPTFGIIGTMAHNHNGTILFIYEKEALHSSENMLKPVNFYLEQLVCPSSYGLFCGDNTGIFFKLSHWVGEKCAEQRFSVAHGERHGGERGVRREGRWREDRACVQDCTVWLVMREWAKEVRSESKEMLRASVWMARWEGKWVW
jgi:hypothetical protein